MRSRGAARVGVALVAAAFLGGILLASGGGPTLGKGGPGTGKPSVTMMEGSSAEFDVRNLPHLPATANRDEVSEHHGPRAALEGPQSYAAVGSGVGPAAAPAPAPLSSFEGLAFNELCTGGQCGDGHPPDTNGDVGPTYYIQTINTSIGIYNKATGTRVAAFTFNSFMSQGDFGNLCDTDNFGDPVVLYDTFVDRWVITDFAFQVDGSGNVVNPPGAYQCIAVSQSGDPVSGGWNFYSLNFTDGLNDYPKLGIWPDGIYMSANMFEFSASDPTPFRNVRVWALDKTAMYAGDPNAQAVWFDVGNIGAPPCPAFSLLPSNARVQTGAPPAGRPNLFASVWCYLNTVDVWKFHVDWTTPTNSTFTGPTNSLTGSSWAVGPGTVPELDGNDLDTLQVRLMMQNQYTNIGGVESIWNTHTVGGTDATQSAVRWYQVPVTGGNVGAAVQASTYNPDAHHRFMPSIAVDRLGDMALGYSVSSATLHPAIRYAGRLAGDALNTITQTETALINGTGAQVGNCGGSPCERWGDYSAMTLDPNGCTFWYTNEYYADLSLNHHTRIGSFRYPGCTDAPPTDEIAPTITTPGRSPDPAIPGATVTVTATAADGVSVASAQMRLDGGAWTAMTAVDGAFGETSEAVTSTITAPPTAGSHQVCVRATDSSGNTSDGTACSTLTVMTFSLAAAPASASVTQGSSASFTINIGRTSFAAAIGLSVSGLPTGATASFSPNPAGGASSVLTIKTSNCGTVTPRGTFNVTVNGSASGLTRSTSVTLTVANGPPKVTALASTLYAISTLGTTTVPVKSKWAACDPDGVTSYQLQRQLNGGSWSTVSLASPTQLSINQALTKDTKYRYRVRATDGLGLTSEYIWAPGFRPIVSDNGSSLIWYTGTWSTGSSASYYGGTVRYATSPGASATYTLIGHSAAWVAYRSSTRGSAQVYVDGVLKATVNLNASTASARVAVFAFSWAASGRHTIKVVVVSGRVDIDAFVRLAPA
ncbi:MAG TPA: hypothetical protein VFV63_03695 [Ilumatobacteraceae bacterium]|nr:hypothetical protein [Ilumatobacteraceae bacterium]